MKISNLIQKSNKAKLVLCNHRNSLLKNPSTKENKQEGRLAQQQKSKIIDKNNQNIVNCSGIVLIQNQNLLKVPEREEKEKLSTNSTVSKQENNSLNFNDLRKIQRRQTASPLHTRVASRKKTQIFHLNQQASKSKNSSFCNQTTEIYQTLLESCIIQSKSSNYLCMKKTSFSQLIQSLLTYFIQSQVEENAMISLQETFKKLKSKVEDLQLQKKAAKLKLQSRTIRLKCNEFAFSKQTKDYECTISDLKNEKQSLEQSIALKKEELQFVKGLCQEKRKMNLFFQRNCLQLTQNLSSRTQQLNKVQRELSQKELLLRNAAEKAENILHFVQVQQEKKVLHWASEAYKQIQEEIYDYAAYLQCNAMASSITWEPKPFRAVQKWVYEQMERVNQFIMSEAESSQDKSMKMKNFITNTTRKFRTKDQQMMKVTDYKTQCIKKYTKMMQKWLQNWELKQEYLVNLRKQFAVESQKINRILQKLESPEIQKENPSQEHERKETIQLLKELWKKVELNYLYGNSFY